jgi:DNA-nicking Smr family endonuclease
MSAFANVGVPRSVPAFNPHRQSQNHADDAEYDRLRQAAAHEADLRGRCFEASKKAYAEGDGSLAHLKSEEGKAHGTKMEQLNEQAAMYVFRANNASCQPDELDLHGLHVDEAKFFTEQRIMACKERREDHLHIIVGKGNHSVNHIQKLKPAIEDLCRRYGFEYSTEHNEGRILVKFPQQGGFLAPGGVPNYPQQPQPTYQQPQQAYQQQGQQGQQGQHGGAGWSQYNTPQNQKMAMNIFKKLFRMFCR